MFGAELSVKELGTSRSYFLVKTHTDSPLQANLFGLDHRGRLLAKD